MLTFYKESANDRAVNNTVVCLAMCLGRVNNMDKHYAVENDKFVVSKGARRIKITLL